MTVLFWTAVDLPRRTIPPSIMVGPPYVLAPLSWSIPLPVLVNPKPFPESAIGPPIPRVFFATFSVLPGVRVTGPAPRFRDDFPPNVKLPPQMMGLLVHRVTELPPVES